MYAVGRCVASIASLIAMGSVLSGCIASLRDPERLFPIPAEMDIIRRSVPTLSEQYSGYIASLPRDQARAVRNEIIAQRMYAIDVQYSAYEASLTRERQEVGFAALTAAEGVNVAGTLLTDGTTRGILNGVAAAILATKGHYESEILLAKTIQIIQKQMRANRSNAAARITLRMGQDIMDYPLSAALSDLEEYYRAGTLTAGVLEASTTIGVEEKNAQNKKETAALVPIRTTYVRDANSSALIGFIWPSGVFNQKNLDDLQTILRDEMGRNELVARIIEGSYGVVTRAELVRRARVKGLKL